MISFYEATQLIFDNVSELGRTDCAIDKAVGRLLYEDITSDIYVASFRSSAMDGFAVCSEWLKDCSDSNRLTFPYRDTVYAGDSPAGRCADGFVVKVMTGAPVPKGYDSVVMFEETFYDDSSVVFCKPVAPGANVRERGEDISPGQMLFSKRDKLRALDIGVLASLGLREVPVFQKPSLRIVTTGSELVPPGHQLEEGKVYNSNLYTVSSMVGSFCRTVDSVGSVTDESGFLKKVLHSDHDVVITTGGVSAGERDRVVKVAESVGWATVFHKVKIKPGKPIYFARRGRQLLFGLPGNPLSAAVTCAIFVLPALKKMAGYRRFQLRLAPARLGSTPVRMSDRMLIWPGTIRQDDTGTIAEFSPKDSSAALSALLGSDGLIFQAALSGSDASAAKIETVRWEQILNY